MGPLKYTRSNLVPLQNLCTLVDPLMEKYCPLEFSYFVGPLKYTRFTIVSANTVPRLSTGGARAKPPLGSANADQCQVRLG